MYTEDMKSTTVSATDARNNFFKILDAVSLNGEEFVVEKEGRVTARIVAEKKRPSAEEIDETLAEFRKVFAKSAKRKYWSVIDTPAWEKKERKYLEKLSKGIID